MSVGEFYYVFRKQIHNYTTCNVLLTSTFRPPSAAVFGKLKEEDNITDEQYKYLHPTAENAQRMYCTPKIDKLDNPLKPIVDYTGSIGTTQGL